MQIWPWWANVPHAPTEAAAAHVDVAHDDQRRVAAQFQVRPLEVLPGQRTDRPPGAGRAGEGDDPDGGLDDQGLADVGPTGQHLQDAGRQARLLEDAGEHRPTADRRARVGLEDHRVAQRQRRRDRADRQDGRHVERRDHADHPRRYAAGERQPRRPGAQQLAVGVGGQRRGLVALLRAGVHLEVTEGLDRAGLPRQPALDLVRVGLQHLSGPPQHPCPLLEGQRRPRLLRLDRAHPRGVHVLRRRLPDLAQRLTGRRLHRARTCRRTPSVHDPVHTLPCQAPSSSSAMSFSPSSGRVPAAQCRPRSRVREQQEAPRQAGSTRTGMLSQARSVLLWCRLVGPASSMRRTRRARAVSSASASSRATCWPDALVDAHAEAHVARGVAGQVEGVGVVPPARVAVGRGEEHQDLLSRPGRRDRRRGRRRWRCGRRSAPATPSAPPRRTPPGRATARSRSRCHWPGWWRTRRGPRTGRAPWCRRRR